MSAHLDRWMERSVALSEQATLGSALAADQLAFAQGLPFPAVGLLEGLGVSRAALSRLAGAGELGRARVSVSRGRFEPGGSEPRLILPVFDADDTIIDQVALMAAEPDSWALRTGEGWALGLAEYERFATRQAIDVDGQCGLRLHGTPIGWLAGGCDGICVLDWGRQALAELRLLGPDVTLMCDDTRAAERLSEALKWGALPGVTVAGRPMRERKAA